MGRIQYGQKEVLLAKLMMASHEWRQERARWHLREDIQRRCYGGRDRLCQKDKVGQTGEQGGGGQAFPTLSRGWWGGVGGNLCFKESRGDKGCKRKNREAGRHLALEETPFCVLMSSLK